VCEETQGRRFPPRTRLDYPRMCGEIRLEAIELWVRLRITPVYGEHDSIDGQLHRVFGSPPRERGIPGVGVGDVAVRRITPA